MVATRHSLPNASLEADSPPEGGQKVRKELRKLQIDGKDALKGDAPAQKAEIQTYHWRGAAYEVTDATADEWVEQQPERWKKRSSIAALDGGNDSDDENQADEESDDAPPSRALRRNLPQHYYGRKKRNSTNNNAPKKRKRSPEPAYEPLNPSKAFDYAIVGGQQQFTCSEAARARAISMGYEYEPINPAFFRNSETLGRRVLKDVVSLAKLNDELKRLERAQYSNTAVLNRLYHLRDLAQTARVPTSTESDPGAAPTLAPRSYNPERILQTESPTAVMREYQARQAQNQQKEEKQAEEHRQKQRAAEWREIHQREQEYGWVAPVEYTPESEHELSNDANEEDDAVSVDSDDCEFILERHDSGTWVPAAFPTNGINKPAPFLLSPFKPKDPFCEDVSPSPPRVSVGGVRVDSKWMREHGFYSRKKSKLTGMINNAAPTARPKSKLNASKKFALPRVPTNDIPAASLLKPKPTVDAGKNQSPPRVPAGEVLTTSKDANDAPTTSRNAMSWSDVTPTPIIVAPTAHPLPQRPPPLANPNDDPLKPLKPITNMTQNPHEHHQLDTHLFGRAFESYQPNTNPLKRSLTSSQPAADFPENPNKRQQMDADHTTTSKGGHKVRWSLPDNIQDVNRAENAVHTDRLVGESKGGRRRRIKREKALLAKWGNDEAAGYNVGAYLDQGLDKQLGLERKVAEWYRRKAAEGITSEKPIVIEDDLNEEPSGNTTISAPSTK